MSKRLAIKVVGVEEVLRKIGKRGAKDLVEELDELTERAARTIANEAADNAPYKSGKLANSIPPSVEKERDMQWIIGSDVEYATRQEYEHSTKKGFFRKALWNGRDPFRQDIRKAIERRDK